GGERGRHARRGRGELAQGRGRRPRPAAGARGRSGDEAARREAGRAHDEGAAAADLGQARQRADDARRAAVSENPVTGAAAERQLRGFSAKFGPADQKLICAVRKAARRRFPTAHELVYDNYNFLVIGYSPTEKPTDSIISIAARANGVGLCFIHGAKLP